MFVTRKNESYRMINCKPGNDEYEFGFTYIQNFYNEVFRLTIDPKVNSISCLQYSEDILTT